MKLYVDGACSGNPGPGGYSCIVLNSNEELIETLSGGEAHTTNNIMEMKGLINALRWCNNNHSTEHKYIIYTDSAYLHNCIHNKWYIKWRKNNWKTTSNQPVANKELWIEILDLYEKLSSQLLLQKVEAHKDNYWNNYADKVAVEARKKIIT